LEVIIVKDNAMITGYATLFTGIGLLAFTFINAYLFLIANSSIIPSSDLIDAFGSALAPLIGASIRIMYLGVMGWIGSSLTARGVQLVVQLKRLARPAIQSRTTPNSTPNEVTQPKKSKKI
jgi:hypothetical protein